MSVRLGTQKITDIVKTSEGTGGTSDYNDLVNKPQINGTVLQGNLTTDDLGIEIPKVDAYTKQETTDLINSAVSDKATIEYVDDNLNLKADKTELEKELASKADINNVYTKEDTEAEIDKKIINKADKTYVDDALDLKANISDTYTKQETDNKLDNLNSSINNKLASKADTTSVYTKEETATVINNAIANKADKTYVDDALGLKADKEDTYTKSEIDDMFDNPTITGDIYPIGAIAPFAGVTTPQNWLLCDGREVSREVYSELFAVIGTTWGAGDGSTSFNLPDLRNRMPVGAGDDYNLASKGGEKEVILNIDQIPPHDHKDGKLNEAIDANNGGRSAVIVHNSESGTIPTTKTGGGQPHNNMPPYVGTYYIIKAKQSAGVVATVVDNLSSTSPTDALSANQGKILNDKFNDGLPVVLYDNSSGVNTSFGLNDNVANYSFIEIYFKRQDVCSFVKIDNPNGKKAMLSLMFGYYYNNVNHFYMFSQQLRIENTNIVYETGYSVHLSNKTISEMGADNSCYVYKVLGYK